MHANASQHTDPISRLMSIAATCCLQPQSAWLGVPQVGIHHEDLDAAIQTYQMLSERWFTHASPTLFNAGTPRPQMSSCFLICMKAREGPALAACLSVRNLTCSCRSSRVVRTWLSRLALSSGSRAELDLRVLQAF